MSPVPTIQRLAKRWRRLRSSPEKLQKLQSELGTSPALCDLLVQRGIEDYGAAERFFNPRIEDLHDPFLLRDMDKAVRRIDAARVRGERILVFGDYDVDGTTAVAVVYSFLSRQYGNVDFYIPHRYREGYGVSRAGIDYAAEHGIPLIVALDCGIKSVELIAYASSLGIDFIVCDHHLPDAVLPLAAAILNPKQPGCPYPFKELCGCGVGFKLVQALGSSWGLPAEEAFANLDLVATAIAADIVPINGENRILAYHGLRKANSTPNWGLRALCQLSKVDRELDIGSLVFVIAPRVNAAGRMDEGGKAVQLFISASLSEALDWAEKLGVNNDERRKADTDITQEALALIQADVTLVARNSTVLFQSHWHKGVVGIVASRLMDYYYRPTIVLTQSGDVVAGSARSVLGFNVYEAVHQCKDLLLGYGGHFYAAGMTMHPDNLEAFCQRFEEVVSMQIHPQLLIPEVTIHTEISFRDITPRFFKSVERMQPWGPENMQPQFLTRGAVDTGHSRVVKEKHLRVVLRQGGVTLSGIGFDLADREPLLRQGPVDVVYKIDENEWEGKKSLQLKVVDIKAAGENALFE